MGAFKEEAITFEEVEKNQERIFSDAADIGYPYKESAPDFRIKSLIDSIRILRKFDANYPDEKPFIRNRQTWKDGVSIEVVIFWEVDEGYYCGTKYTITFNRIKPNHPSNLHKGCNAFISVESKRYTEKVK